MNTFLRKCCIAASAIFLCTAFEVSAVAFTHEEAKTKTPPVAGSSAASTSTAPIEEFVSIDSVNHTKQNPQSIQDTVLPPCDIVFYKSGKLEYCKILETSPTTISYKMCDYQDGPTIVVNKSDIHKIRYANGREDIVDANQGPVKNAYSRGRKDKLATYSMILGIISASILLLIGYFIPVVAIGAVVLGVISLIRISRRRGELRGKGSALIGVILGLLTIIIVLALA